MMCSKRSINNIFSDILKFYIVKFMAHTHYSRLIENMQMMCELNLIYVGKGSKKRKIKSCFIPSVGNN